MLLSLVRVSTWQPSGRQLWALRGPSLALTAPWGRCLGGAGLLELSQGVAELLLPRGHWAYKWPLAAAEQGRVPGVLFQPASPTVGPSWPQVTAPALG